MPSLFLLIGSDNKPRVTIVESVNQAGDSAYADMFDVTGNFHWCPQRDMDECIIVSY